MTKSNHSLTVKRSRIGLGLFTQQPIGANRRIVEYIGTIIPREQRKRVGGKYLFELEDRSAIDGRQRSNIARYINHSCCPNAIAHTSGKRIWIWSLRAIKAGEEITINYGKQYLDEFVKPGGCKCEKCAPQSKVKQKKSR